MFDICVPEEKSLADNFTLLNSGAAAVSVLLYFPTCMELTCLLRMCVNVSSCTEHFTALKKGK